MPKLRKPRVKIRSTKKTGLFVKRDKRPSFIVGVLLTAATMFLVVLLSAGAAGMGTALGVVRAYMSTSPSLDLTRLEETAQTTFIYDSKGTLITTYKGLENRIWATIDVIPKQLQDAFIAIEDVRFYQHGGVDYKRLFGAVISNTQSGTSQGGSTITQQLIKMRIVGAAASYKRKLQEAYLATQLEKKYTKDQILEAYLNTVPLGGINYGVKAAAFDFFDKDLSELTLRECATLAGITRSPNGYDPRMNYYDRATPERTDKRTDLVLKSMYNNGFITKQQYEEALGDQLVVVPKKPTATGGNYSNIYGVEYAIYNICELILQQRNMANTHANRATVENELRNGGYHIYTTLDLDIQEQLEQTVVNYTSWPRMRDVANDGVNKVKGPDGNLIDVIQPQCSIVILDKPTAQVKAIMGGRNLPVSLKQFNRVIGIRDDAAAMPVGSSIKPLACFAPALEKGYSPASRVANIKAPINGWYSETGYPKNYTASQYSGQMTLREGLRRSINVVAARTLLDLVSINESVETLVKLGVNRNRIAATGSGLALGSSGLTTLEMAQAYCAIANGGYYRQAVAFTTIVDSSEQVVYSSETIRKQYSVFREGTAWMLLDMMKDALGPGGTGSRAVFPGMTIAGKTGTNDDERGVFFSGITPYYVSTVWIGSDVYKPLVQEATGGGYSCPLWKAYMQPLHAGLENKPIFDAQPVDIGLVRAKVCGVSGFGLTPFCPEEGQTEDWFHADGMQNTPCPMHVGVSVCSVSGKPATIYCPEEHVSEFGVTYCDENSPYRSISKDDAVAYIGNFYTSIPKVDDTIHMALNDPARSQYCQAHGPNTVQSDYQPALVLEASGLLAKARYVLSDHRASISAAQAQEINAVVLGLERALSQEGLTTEEFMELIVWSRTTLRNIWSDKMLPGGQTGPAEDPPPVDDDPSPDVHAPIATPPPEDDLASEPDE